MSLVSIARRPSHVLASPALSARDGVANHEGLEQRRYSSSLCEAVIARHVNQLHHGLGSTGNSPTPDAARNADALLNNSDSVFADERNASNHQFQEAEIAVALDSAQSEKEDSVEPLPSSNYYTIKGAAVFLNSQLASAVRPRTPVVKHDDSFFPSSTPLSPSTLVSYNSSSPPASPTSQQQLPSPPAEISRHLGLMLGRLRDEDQIMMAAKLESGCANRARYLTLIYNSHATNLDHSTHSNENNNSEDASLSALLGFDVTWDQQADGEEQGEERVSLGLAVPVLGDMTIRLTGDGGFSTSLNDRSYSFKPVAVQVMWACLHSVTETIARAGRNIRCLSASSSLSSAWLDFYNQNIDSDSSAIADWQLMDDVISRLPPADSESVIELEIRDQLRNLMSSIDLEEASSRAIRSSLETAMGRDLSAYRQYIDEEMLVLLGQLDLPSEIFDYLYLGSEWNASDIRVLTRLGITHVVNVSREIDNFFPAHFRYFNVRVYDDESTELLRYWNSVFKFIENARRSNGRILVHCKMGVSRSAACVIAYCMKAVGQSRDEAIDFVRSRRACVQPNKGFMDQLQVYEGILKASRVRHSDLFKHVDAMVNDSTSPSKPSTLPPMKLVSFHEGEVLQQSGSDPLYATMGSRIAVFETNSTASSQQQAHGNKHFRSQEERRLRNRTSPAVPSARTLEFPDVPIHRRAVFMNEATGSKEDLCSADYYPETGHVRRVTAQLMTPLSSHSPSAKARAGLTTSKRATVAKFPPSETRRSSTGIATDSTPRGSWPLCQHETARIACEK